MSESNRETAGRPPFFESWEELAKAIESWIEKVDSNETKATITGLAYHLGFESRQSFYDYREREEFSYIVKRAHLYIEMKYEEKLQDNNSTGAIFALKNMNWSDKVETDLSIHTEQPLFTNKDK